MCFFSIRGERQIYQDNTIFKKWLRDFFDVNHHGQPLFLLKLAFSLPQRVSGRGSIRLAQGAFAAGQAGTGGQLSPASGAAPRGACPGPYGHHSRESRKEGRM